ncbi:MAG: alpha/beta fold hydrolase [Planctomycetota bacterium]|jgi:pimeloyl-ACP methyl ester carboxylesterase
MKRIILILTLLTISGCTTVSHKIQYGSNENAGAYKEINGIKIYYEIYSQGEPVLLLHGGTCHISYHSPLIELLAKNYKVIAADSRGHGRSTLGKTKLSYPLLANDMAKLIDQLDVGPVTVIGHSDGGVIGYILAAKYPDKIKALVSTGANYRKSGRGGLTPEALEWIKNLTPEKVAKWGKTRLHGPAKENYLALNPEPNWDHFITRLLNELWLSDSDLDENDLRNIKCPVLISHGEEENFVKLQDIIYMSELIENADIYIAPNGNHRHHVDQIDAFGPILLRFLKRVYGHQDR